MNVVIATNHIYGIGKFGQTPKKVHLGRCRQQRGTAEMPGGGGAGCSSGRYSNASWFQSINEQHTRRN